jgi:hypothetical protein
MADEKRIPDPQKATPAPKSKPPVAEREPLTVTVLDATTAEPALQVETVAQTGVGVEIPTRVEAPPRSSMLLYIAAIGGVLLFSFYRLQYAPLVLRFEHGIERRIYGHRSYEAHREPKSRGVAIRPGE